MYIISNFSFPFSFLNFNSKHYGVFVFGQEFHQDGMPDRPWSERRKEGRQKQYIETGHGHLKQAICATHVQTVTYGACQSLGTWKASETTKAAFTVKLKKSLNREREG